ncbi:MAG: winged helix-turn-helix domain-containing protein [Burkholderiales bacterium]|nr:winged helix-turn-helix domain-containing protein [Burkholderiales bacterium]
MHGAAARERLYRRLDDAMTRPGLCVVGPPGAGKTTLVASWLDSREVPGIWYQVDSGDADLSTFFYYLQLGAEPFRRRRQSPLPLLTPEYRGELESFARRFFRELFARLPESAVVVLDNYQEVGPSERFHQLVAEAMSEVPPGNLLAVISRHDPPDSYARLKANSAVTMLDWDDLRLTMEETRALSGTRSSDPAQLERLHALCGGWAAGLTLLLERGNAGQLLPPDDVTHLDNVFRFFAAQILDQLDGDMRRFLLQTSCLPRVPVGIARALTGNDRAGTILDELYRRHLFVHRRPGVEATYQYHALFQTFLCRRAADEMPVAQRLVLERRAAMLLEKAEQVEDAFALYRQASAWAQAASLALREAPVLLAQGRARTVKEWIAALPVPVRAADPWFDYWQGQADLAEDQALARVLFERAADGFQVRGDALGVALSVCGVIDSIYFEWSDFSPMSQCVDRLQRLIDGGRLPGRPEVELKVQSSLLIAMLYGTPGHRALTHCVEKVGSLLSADLDMNLRVGSATSLMTYSSLALDGPRGRAVKSIVRPLLVDRRITPLNQLWWLVRSAWFDFRIEGQDHDALALLDAAEALIEAHDLSGLRSARMLIASYRNDILMTRGSWQQARSVRQAVSQIENAERPVHAYLVTIMELKRAVSAGDSREMKRLAPIAHETAHRSGMPYVQMQAALFHAITRAVEGDLAETGELCDVVARMTHGTCFTWFQTEAGFLKAVAAMRGGQEELLPELMPAAFGTARVRGHTFPERGYAGFVDLCARALEAGIESEYVESVIRRFRLPAPDQLVPFWPWPIEVLALGDFRIMRDGVPVEYGARAPAKVLALLKALIALGGQNVPYAALIDALWSDEEGDAASNALGVTVSRLRKLLGCADAILVADERISLNLQRCWVDAFALERLVERFPDNGDDAAARRFIDRVLALYRGQFLPADTGQRWSMQMRMRLRDRFVRFVERAGARLEAAGDMDGAIDCYRKGLDADDLAEEFYQGLMRCYLAQQRPAEGMQVFRRLRQTLSVLLGLSPSPRSQSLSADLQRVGQAASAQIRT